jgi:hypothetical protein
VISLPQNPPAGFSNKNALWTGPEPWEGRAAYRRAREAGMSALRAFVIGEIATHRDCWKFRRSIAKIVGCCIRTVQRAITQAKELGLLRAHRAKKGEIPPRPPDHPRAGEPIDCGWSHRFTVGRGLAGRPLAVAIEAARAKWITRQVLRATSSTVLPKRRTSPEPRVVSQKRSFTAEQIDAELARRDAERPPPSPSSREGPD